MLAPRHSIHEALVSLLLKHACDPDILITGARL